MKYTELTQEQKESITPYLRELFEHKIYCLDKIGRHDDIEIKAYQQAQKAEIEFLHELVMFEDEDDCIDGCECIWCERFRKLNLESELE